MGIVAGLGAAAAAGSLGSTIYGAVSGGSGGSTGGYSSGSTPPQSYIPTGQPGADQLYQTLYGQLANQGESLQSLTPAYYNYSNALQSNPYGAGMQNANNTASAYGVNTLAPQQQQSATSLFGAGSSVLNTAFDPQRALYNQQQQQNTDQSNAIAAMNGVAGSPYAAGLANQSNQNFNIAWQNAQLQRQAQGIQSAGQAYSGGSDLGGSAINTASTAGALPYSTYNQTTNDALSGLNSYVTGINNISGLDQNTLNALAAYLKLGQSATSVGQQGAAQTAANNSAIGTGIGSALSQLGNNPGLAQLFGGSGNASSAGLGGYTTQPTSYDPSYFDSSSNADYGNAGY